MSDVIVSIVTPKDVIEMFFSSVEEALEYVRTSYYAVNNQNKDQVVQFCIRSDRECPDEPTKA